MDMFYIVLCERDHCIFCDTHLTFEEAVYKNKKNMDNICCKYCFCTLHGMMDRKNLAFQVILDQKDAQMHACLTTQTFQSGDTEQNISSESRNINQGI